MAIEITGRIAPAGAFAVVDYKDATGNITGSSISASGDISSSSGIFAWGASSFNSTLTVGSTLTANALTIGAITSTDNISTTGNLTVDGNLEVKGETTVINTEVLTIQDPFILINSGSANNKDAGIVVQSGSNNTSGSALFFDQSAGRWGTASDVDATGDYGVNIGEGGYGEINGHIPIVKKGGGIPAVSGSSSHVGDFFVDAANELWFKDT